MIPSDPAHLASASKGNQDIQVLHMSKQCSWRFGPFFVVAPLRKHRGQLHCEGCARHLAAFGPHERRTTGRRVSTSMEGCHRSKPRWVRRGCSSWTTKRPLTRRIKRKSGGKPPCTSQAGKGRQFKCQESKYPATKTQSHANGEHHRHASTVSYFQSASNPHLSVVKGKVFAVRGRVQVGNGLGLASGAHHARPSELAS